MTLFRSVAVTGVDLVLGAIHQADDIGLVADDDEGRCEHAEGRVDTRIAPGIRD